jgi:hypothetical protein
MQNLSAAISGAGNISADGSAGEVLAEDFTIF